ncbi:hypothetical protein CUT44_02515 [Streptomyces carminius]|uniref:Uncharacterized protein n=1 Tax=Streptomyces carminius TaxID=2665496 RepID=A0A2M8MBH2_9ACTN|nr:hypothetical protein [Streptomyces carminius]PJF01551.1 hypothetical protein CUT44_02515 [Streptomyces carminius]
MSVEEPVRGEVFYDEARGTVGEFQDRDAGCYFLRPVGGGREWTARPGALRPATQAESLSARVAAANHAAGRGR